MRLPRDGQEFAHIVFDELPDGVVVEVSTDDRVSWVPTVVGESSLERLLLLRGPDSVRVEGHLVGVSSIFWVRLRDVPEDVIREAGGVFLV